MWMNAAMSYPVQCCSHSLSCAGLGLMMPCATNRSVTNALTATAYACGSSMRSFCSRFMSGSDCMSGLIPYITWYPDAAEA